MKIHQAVVLLYMYMYYMYCVHAVLSTFIMTSIQTVRDRQTDRDRHWSRSTKACNTQSF